MSGLTLAAIIVLLAVGAYVLGRSQSLRTVSGNIKNLHSLPGYYGLYAAIWCAIPALIIVLAWTVASSDIIEAIVQGSLPADLANMPKDRMSLFMTDVRNAVTGNIVSNPSPEVLAAAGHYSSLQSISTWALTVVGLAVSIGGLWLSRQRIVPYLKSREAVERIVIIAMIVASTIAILTTIGIVVSLFFEAYRFFLKVPLTDFLFGLEWSPQTAIRADQVGSSGAFGAIPVFAGTLLITLIAMCVSVPVGLMSAIYMSEYASPRVRSFAKLLLEILAGIPTVVYGFFAALTVAPFFRGLGESVGLEVSSESALAAGVAMGIMIIPFVSSLSDDVITAVPRALRDGSHGLGATKSETITKVVLPAALPGIVGAVLLAVSRAIGETMIVVMAAGLASNLTANPFEAVTTVTVQVVTLLVGDQEFDSAKTLAAFALGLILFFVTLALSVVALSVVRQYREKYD